MNGMIPKKIKGFRIHILNLMNLEKRSLNGQGRSMNFTALSTGIPLYSSMPKIWGNIFPIRKPLPKVYIHFAIRKRSLFTRMTVPS